MTRRMFLRWIAAGVLSITSVATFAQYPSQPVKIILPYGTGGVADITARVLAQKLSEQMGQQVIVDNRPSAGQIVASEAVKKAEPDGYTLLWLNGGHAVSKSLFNSLPYDAEKDFAPVSTVAFFGMALLVDSSSPYRTVKEFIDAAKANPGKFNVGTTSLGSTQSIAGLLFKSMAGVDLQVVPYKATPMIVTSVKGGDLQAMFEFLTPTLSHVKSGNLRALGVSYSHRFEGLPDIPTIAETVPGYEATSWNAAAAPAKTPKAIIDRLNREINTAMAVPEVRQRLIGLGVEPRAGTPQELHDLLVSETAKWAKVIEAAHIPKQ
ncbi:MAG TPA: tripartite tricarboxylate transporter substrate-binding protein [Burkholderiales bacterium]|nr:tripartite tricarboxylate transporter substrate-binding protein [Burkholderiales bacterium]